MILRYLLSLSFKKTMTDTARKLYIFVILATLFAANVFAQTASPTPRQEKLLNGLKIYIFDRSPEKLVTIKIRVHNGSAFDPQEKDGVMKLLADSIFSTDVARQYFADEFGGSLDIACTYDYIEVTAKGTPDKFLSMLELLADSITAPDTEEETVARLKADQLDRIKMLENDASYSADHDVAEALFGTFPYGRAIDGTESSLAKLDRADLIFARQRLFSADNASVAIEGGGIDASLAVRAARRYFGAWLKADKKFPSTFKQPDEPEAKLQVRPANTDDTSELRFAVRGASRAGKEFAASEIAALIYDKRFKAKAGSGAFARNETHFLPGSVVFGIHDWQPENTARLDAETSALLQSVIDPAITQAEFDSAKKEFIAKYAGRDRLGAWLDVDTYKPRPIKDENAAFEKTALKDVQAFADGLKTRSFVKVLLASPIQAAPKETPAADNN
jgi:predicted Zn-dependent peptidase